MQKVSDLFIFYSCPFTANEISLKSIVQPKVVGAYSSLHVIVELIISEGQNVTVIDDLSLIGITQSSIKLIVHKDASLSYKNYLSLQKALFEGQKTIVRKNCLVQLAQQGAHAELLFYCKSEKQDQFLITTEQLHSAERTTSSVVIKAVLDDDSSVRSNTLIKVEKSAHQVKAEQTSKNIMLSKQARAVAIPKLEVLADDVSCTHGAAVSMVDPEILFYLQSRGLNQLESKEMMVAAFLGETFS